MITAQLVLLGMLLGVLHLVAGAPQSLFSKSFTFNSGVEGWSPRSTSISLKWDSAFGRTAAGSLFINGTAPSPTWNYAMSPSIDFTSLRGDFIQLTAWLRVPSLPSSTPLIYLKIQFSNSQMGTTTIQKSASSDWQRVVLQFTVPDDATTAVLAVEKGTKETTSLAPNGIWLDDVVLAQVTTLDPWFGHQKYVPSATLEAVRGVHPRLFFTAKQFTDLLATKTDPKHVWWTPLLQEVANIMKSSPPAYTLHGDQSGDEQLYQRSVGTNIVAPAFMFKVTGDSSYLSKAVEWAMASCSYPTWGLGEFNISDLAAGHQLFGLSMLYDWCFDDLTATQKSTIRSTLITRGTIMAMRAAQHEAFWYKSYLQNHLWVGMTGYYAAALALFDDTTAETNSLYSIQMALDAMKMTVSVLGSDGASHEGVGYHQYGLEYMIKFLHLTRTLIGEDLISTSQWWQNTASYMLYLSLPRNSWSSTQSIIDLADCPRVNWYGPDYLLFFLASRYSDPTAQWHATQIINSKISAKAASWMPASWFDASLTPISPQSAGLPTTKHFADIGIVSVRSDWSGDESLLVIKCGPPLGHEYAKWSVSLGDTGSGHTHGDAGHFTLFGGKSGKFLMSDDGYQDKHPTQHNTLAISRGDSEYFGQCGEDHEWLNGIQCYQNANHLLSKVVSVESYESMGAVYVQVDAAPAYQHLASSTYNITVSKFTRHFFYFKQHDMMVVVDDLAVVSTDATTKLHLLFHPETLPWVSSSNVVLMNGTKEDLRMELLTDENVKLTVGAMQLGTSEVAMKTIKLTATAATTWKNAVVFSWGKRFSSSSSPLCTMKLVRSTDGEIWQFVPSVDCALTNSSTTTALLETVSFNWNTNSFDVPLSASQCLFISLSLLGVLLALHLLL